MKYFSLAVMALANIIICLCLLNVGAPFFLVLGFALLLGCWGTGLWLLAVWLGVFDEF
jgi:hypothetical protein